MAPATSLEALEALHLLEDLRALQHPLEDSEALQNPEDLEDSVAQQDPEDSEALRLLEDLEALRLEISRLPPSKILKASVAPHLPEALERRRAVAAVLEAAVLEPWTLDRL